MGKIMHGGIEYSGGGSGGGGSTVTITPTLATGTKIADFEIDGTTGELYAPQGGGGGGAYSETDVWTGSGNMYNTLSITLNHNYTNYDALRFEYKAVRADAQSIPLHYEKTVSKSTLGTSERFIISDFYLWNNVGVCVSGTFTTLTALTTYLETKNWFSSCTLTKIVGIKY